MHNTIQIEVIYALAQEQVCVQLDMAPGTTAMNAIRQSGLLERFGLDEQAIVPDHIGLFGKKCLPDTRLHDQDRVEIYRPLLLSPTEARRLRAQTMADKAQ